MKAEKGERNARKTKIHQTIINDQVIINAIITHAHTRSSVKQFSLFLLIGSMQPMEKEKAWVESCGDNTSEKKKVNKTKVNDLCGCHRINDKHNDFV